MREGQIQRDQGELNHRFSDPPLLILISLSSGPKHGYAMMQDILEFSGTQLEPGTLYGALARLERLGLIAPLASEDRRRPYRITASGEAWLRDRLQVLERISETSRRRLALRVATGGWRC
ncbi:MAG: PadR family transcriptional regulator [Alicyclobacillaceae bacterium]|nr:PadR family transcriptional regulator [Alicyclobacillaceae bacterium]